MAIGGSSSILQTNTKRMRSGSLVALASLALINCATAFVSPSPKLHQYSLPVQQQQQYRPLISSKPTNLNSSSKDDSSFSPSRIFKNVASELLPPQAAKRMETLTMDMQDFLDRVTDGWALSFADLTPESPKTLLGQSFLLTNAAYLMAGVTLTLVYNDFWLALWTDVAAVCSYNYHYTQLQACSSSEQDRVSAKEEVRLALLLDYSAAGVSILSALYYLISTIVASHMLSPLEGQAMVVSLAGVGCLLLSWKWEYGRPYMFWHGLWHLGSASAGYLIGVSHQQVMSVL
ncbi:hypothetical protein MPSEU_000268400 [Mayamaea pseudoterrestris]|nr:hypothetical protein MPSEU_000268400 [Mayamaea pseudoterrestris]